ncbi:MAG: UDP-N-acetylmuramate dehydrogenase [Bacteroidetes bacterium]|nr:UDP-N-acetylmuramate dehydrogenase [Bacteroidota bacterium]
MAQIELNTSLRNYNTFRIDINAKSFARFNSLETLEEVLSTQHNQKILILGGGSNILFTKDYEGLVIKNEMKGITEMHEDEEYVFIKVGAGENWHQFVRYTIDKGWGGLENLSFIPGTVGAAPIQNIGAYGVEFESVLWNIEAYHFEDRRVVNFTKSDCEFGYRNSVFKNKFNQQFAILNVTVQLRKSPKFNISYGAIEKELEKMNIKSLSVKAISDAVIHIRSSKLPDPAVLGNAGSFFKNPIVEKETYERLKNLYPQIVAYPSIDEVKLSAGWLIDQCGWKGKRVGDIGCYEKQALVLVNYGNASGKDVFHFSEKIMDSVWEKFNVKLEREVNVL